MFPTSLRPLLIAAAVSLQTVGVRAATVPADQIKDRTEAAPERLNGVDVVEHPGAQLPLDAEFRDSTGALVRLGSYFDGEHPVVVTFNYSDCPMLCSIQLNHFVATLRQVDKTVGKDFKVLTLSIDPAEAPERAAETKLRYQGDYGRPEAAAGWQFLTSATQTRVVADAVGFGYAYNEVRKEWLHAAAIVIATPDGKVARYLYGLDHLPETLEYSLIEASAGKIASTVDRLLLYCFHYDESEGRYAPVAMNIMRLGGGMTALALGILLAGFWARERRRKHQDGSRDNLSPTTAS
jgi:protein SCO1/2